MEPITVISGAVYAMDRADVDTDQIMPKQFLKRIERTGYGEYLFHDWVRNGEVTLTRAPIMAAGRNFGCGSSREHAVWGIHQYGFEAVVAPSFSDIFYGNCTKDGLLPVVLPEEDVRALMAAGSAVIDLPEQTVSFGDRVVRFEIDPTVKDRLVRGLDEIGLTLTRADEIDAYERVRAIPGPVTTRL